MILVYVDNKDVPDFDASGFGSNVSYRNPRLWDGKAEKKVDGVYVAGNYPEIEKAYDGKLLTKSGKKSSKNS